MSLWLSGSESGTRSCSSSFHFNKIKLGSIWHHFPKYYYKKFWLLRCEPLLNANILLQQEIHHNEEVKKPFNWTLKRWNEETNSQRQSADHIMLWKNINASQLEDGAQSIYWSWEVLKITLRARKAWRTLIQSQPSTGTFVSSLFVCLLLAFTARRSSHTQTHTQSSSVSALHRCCSYNCRVATGWCPLLLCLLEMFVINKDEGGRQREGGRRGGRGRGRGRKETGREGERKCVSECSEVRERWSDLQLKSIIIQNKALSGRPATPPPDSQDSFSHNSSDPRPGLSSICQPVCDNYHFEMPACHRASSVPC